MKSIFLLAENFRSCAACLSAHWSRGQLFEHPSWASAYSWKQNSAWDMLQRRVAATKEGNELSGGMGHACSIITAPLLSGKVEMFEHCNQILDFLSQSMGCAWFLCPLSFICVLWNVQPWLCRDESAAVRTNVLSGQSHRSTPKPSFVLGTNVVSVQCYNAWLECYILTDTIK